jgi:hypothetical protein
LNQPIQPKSQQAASDQKDQQNKQAEKENRATHKTTNRQMNKANNNKINRLMPARKMDKPVNRPPKCLR